MASKRTARALIWIAPATALAAAVAACGYPSFTYSPASGGAGGQSAATTTTATTSSSTTTTTATTTSASSSSGSMNCRLLHDAEDCGSGKRCTIVDQSQGVTGCKPLDAAAMSAYDACVDDSTCPRGAWCDYRTGVCSPFCSSSNDCSGGAGSCVAAKNSSGQSIPQASVCTAHCDPVDAQSCGLNAACNYDSMAGDFDCFVSQGKFYGDTCNFGDCAPTLVCGGTCLQWCHPAGSTSLDCGGGNCKHFSNLSPMYDGDAYGYCE